MKHRWAEDGFNPADLCEVYDRCERCGARRVRVWNRETARLRTLGYGEAGATNFAAKAPACTGKESEA